MIDTLIIIPVFNEAEIIEKVAEATQLHSSSFADILFINDGSTDGSAEILNLLPEKSERIHVVNKILNEGYGSSLITGFNYALKNSYDYCIIMDCDDQHQPTDLPRFYDIDKSIDLVSGSRYLPESKQMGITPPGDRVEINRRITYLINKYYKLNLTDSFCGFKRYKLSAFKNHTFSVKGYASPLELWSYVYHNHLSLTELAVDRIYITDDRSFGDDLDKKRKRYHYYLKIWNYSHKKYKEIGKVHS